MSDTLVLTCLPRWLCPDSHESFGHDLDRCQHFACDQPLTRVCADGRRWAPRSKRG